MNSTTKVATWFTVIAVLAIIWNLMGVMAYFAEAFMTPETMELLPQEQQDAYASKPAWATGAFALAVFGGLLGSIFLALKKNIAKTFLIVSLVSVIVSDLYSFIIIDSISIVGMFALYMQLFVFVVAVYLIILFNQAKSKNWIK